MKKRVCAFIVLITACVEVVSAQQAGGARSLELTLSESFSTHSKKSFQIGSPQSSTPIDGEMKIRSNNRHEARFNFLTKGRFGSEAYYSFESSSVDFTRTTAPADSLSIPLDVHHFGINILYYPLGTETSAWRPFVNFGGGAMLYRPIAEGQKIATDPLRGNLSDFFESSKAAVDFGVGVKRSLTRSFGVRFDVGNVMTAVPTFGLPTSSSDPNVSVLPIGGRVNNPYASLGITLYLGR
jgi:hypothetical protein